MVVGFVAMILSGIIRLSILYILGSVFYRVCIILSQLLGSNGIWWLQYACPEDVIR